MRIQRIKDLEDELADLKTRISFKEKRRDQAETVRNYKLCDELTADIQDLKSLTREHERELLVFQKKQKRARRREAKKSFDSSCSDSRSRSVTPVSAFSSRARSPEYLSVSSDIEPSDGWLSPPTIYASQQGYLSDMEQSDCEPVIPSLRPSRSRTLSLAKPLPARALRESLLSSPPLRVPLGSPLKHLRPKQDLQVPPRHERNSLPSFPHDSQRRLRAEQDPQPSSPPQDPQPRPIPEQDPQPSSPPQDPQPRPIAEQDAQPSSPPQDPQPCPIPEQDPQPRPIPEQDPQPSIAPLSSHF